MNEFLKLLPEMKTGEALLEAISEYPPYTEDIKRKGSAERLLALSSIYDIYIPSGMSAEIYHKLYMALMRSLRKKETLQAVSQPYENKESIKGSRHHGILGGSDCFTIIGKSGIGKSTTISRSVQLIAEKPVLSMEKPYRKIIPCIVVQCPFDCSVKGMLLEILRKVDELLESRYHMSALRARATTDMLVGSVSQVALQHIGLLIVDEIQNVVNSRNGKSLIGMLTQLINNSGISICMVGTPESTVFFEQALQLARRSLGLSYGDMEFDGSFEKVCWLLWRYQYTKGAVDLNPEILEWLYGHSGGNLSVLVTLVHDAQEIAILEGREKLDMEALQAAYEKRLSMLHGYLEGVTRRRTKVSAKKTGTAKEQGEKVTDALDTEKEGLQDILKEESLEQLVQRAKEEERDVVEVFRQYFTVEEVKV